MEITNDIYLRGTIWSKSIDAFSSIFRTRPHYMIFMLALSIGIMYDKRISKPSGDTDNIKTVPRNVIRNNENGNLDFMFQAAILTTRTENFSEEERLELAFGEKSDFNKMSFLLEYANYGITKLYEQKGETDLESMTNIKDFLTSTVKGNNFEINALPDDVLLED